MATHWNTFDAGISIVADNCVFVIDEISQVSLSTLSLFGRYAHLGARFVLVGDFEGQFLPVADGWPTTRPIMDTSLLKRITRNLHVRLTQKQAGKR